MERKYYEAYDDRYRQIHCDNLTWFHENPSCIVTDVIRRYGISTSDRLLELGCGEGRDAIPLLRMGLDLLATDVSQEAVVFCKKRYPEFLEHFSVLDCVGGELEEKFDYIYAVAVVHMLVLDSHRSAFYQFIHDHLKPDGIALICTMGDGNIERETDIENAFELQERVHEQTGKVVRIANTSCRMVSFDTFRRELKQNELAIIEDGITSIEPDFPVMMYAVVKSA